MAMPLLTTKLYIPPVRPELVSRPRLIERLNAGLDGKLTLISAPAGFGTAVRLEILGLITPGYRARKSRMCCWWPGGFLKVGFSEGFVVLLAMPDNPT
jgi:hypothetical protein